MEKKYNQQTATTPEQSKRLMAYGLSYKTADMTWSWYENRHGSGYDINATPFHYGTFDDRDLPAWSFAALLAMLPANIERRGNGKWWLEIGRDCDGLYYAGYRQNNNHMLEPTPIHTTDPFEALMPVVAWLKSEKLGLEPPLFEAATVRSVVDMINLLPTETREEIITQLTRREQC